MDYQLDRHWDTPVRYPDPAVEKIDRRCARYRLGSAAVERIWTGGRVTVLLDHFDGKRLNAPNDVIDGIRLSNPRVFCDLGDASPDEHAPTHRYG